MAFVVRTAGDARGAGAGDPRRGDRARSGAADLAVSTPWSSTSRPPLARPKFMSTLVGSFGLLALLLSTVGVYGVMAYSVTQRTREIAIRTALGASSRNVLRLVIGKAMWLAVIGVAVRACRFDGVVAGAVRPAVRDWSRGPGHLHRSGRVACCRRARRRGAAGLARDPDPGGAGAAVGETGLAAASPDRLTTSADTRPSGRRRRSRGVRTNCPVPPE